MKPVDFVILRVLESAATQSLVVLLEKLGVIWDVQLPSDAQIAAKLRSASEAKMGSSVVCE